MNFGSLPQINKPISRLVQGTIMCTTKDQAFTNELLDAVYAAGINTFDTAHVYGMGECEKSVGSWISSRGIRDKVVLIGKGAHPYNGVDRVSPAYIRADIADTLERLQTDYIDIYILHRDVPNVPVGPLVDVLNEFVEQGVIGAVGGSNWTPDRLEAANAYADVNGLHRLSVSSPNFSLAEQAIPPWEGCVTISGPQYAADRAWYTEQQMPLFTWSSLAGGFFSGRFRPDNLETFDSYFDKLCVDVYCFGENWNRLERAKELAAERQLSVAQIAIAYVLNQPMNVYALVAAWKPEEAADSVLAAEIKLTSAEINWLESGR